MKYRKKPIEVEAFRYGDEIPEWAQDKIECIMPGQLIVRTLEGDMLIQLGDYIIKGIKGEIYSCKADIFNLTYEEIK